MEYNHSENVIDTIDKMLVDISIVDDCSSITKKELRKALYDSKNEIVYLRNHIKTIAECERVTSTTMLRLWEKCYELTKIWKKYAN